MKRSMITITTSLLLIASTGDAASVHSKTRTTHKKGNFGRKTFRPEGGFILKKGQVLPDARLG